MPSHPTWKCLACKGQRLRPSGVASHRAMHRRRQELVQMEVVRGMQTILYTYDFRPKSQEG